MELYSNSIENAVTSWKVVQGLPDYRTLVGELLFREIFKISPTAVNLYGFGEGVDAYDMPETLFKLPAFQIHTNGVVTMLETALVMMLGNDMETLVKELSTLGAKHVTYGIQPPHYIVVESALVRTLELGLGDKFTLALRKDWEAVFRFVSRAMQMGAGNRVEIVKSQRRTAERKKVATLRLNAISQGKRSKALTRNSRTIPCSRFDAGDFGMKNNSKHRRRASDPPQQPIRKIPSSSMRRHSYSMSDLPSTGSDDLFMEDLTLDSGDETEDTRPETVSSVYDYDDYWSWGNESNVEPPRKPRRIEKFVVKNESSTLSPPRKPSRSPVRTLTPEPHRTPLLFRNSSFDSVSTQGSGDSAPVFPRRASSPPRHPRAAAASLIHHCISPTAC